MDDVIKFLEVSNTDHRFADQKRMMIASPPLRRPFPVTESVVLPPDLRWSIMPSVQPNQLFSRAEIGILACSKCGKPMRFSCIEPAAPGYDIRTFECVECNSSERFSVAI